MLVIILGRAVQFILLLLVMWGATTVLPQQEMGRLSLIAAASGFYALLPANPVGKFINRRLHAWDAQEHPKYYLKLYWTYLAGVSVILAISMLVWSGMHVFGFQFDAAWLFVLSSGSLFLKTINQTVIQSLNLLEIRGWLATLTLAMIATGLQSAYLLVPISRRFHTVVSHMGLQGG